MAVKCMWTNDRKELIQAMLEKGMTHKEIATALGCTVSALRGILFRMRKEHYDVPSIPRCSKARKDLDLIMDLKARGNTQKAIASVLGYSTSTISVLIREELSKNQGTPLSPVADSAAQDAAEPETDMTPVESVPETVVSELPDTEPVMEAAMTPVEPAPVIVQPRSSNIISIEIDPRDFNLNSGAPDIIEIPIVLRFTADINMQSADAVVREADVAC